MRRNREDKPEAKTPTRADSMRLAGGAWLIFGRRKSLHYRMAGENWQVALHRGKHWQLETCETWSNMNPRVSWAKTGTLGPKIGPPPQPATQQAAALGESLRVSAQRSVNVRSVWQVVAK